MKLMILALLTLSFSRLSIAQDQCVSCHNEVAPGTTNQDVQELTENTVVIIERYRDRVVEVQGTPADARRKEIVDNYRTLNCRAENRLDGSEVFLRFELYGYLHGDQDGEGDNDENLYVGGLYNLDVFYRPADAVSNSRPFYIGRSVGDQAVPLRITAEEGSAATYIEFGQASDTAGIRGERNSWYRTYQLGPDGQRNYNWTERVESPITRVSGRERVSSYLYLNDLSEQAEGIMDSFGMRISNLSCNNVSE